MISFTFYSKSKETIDQMSKIIDQCIYSNQHAVATTPCCIEDSWYKDLVLLDEDSPTSEKLAIPICLDEIMF